MAKRLLAGVALVVAALSPGGALAATTPACGQLSALRLPDLRIVSAQPVRPDPVWLAPVAQTPGARALPVHKPFCRVEGTIEDEIGFELWLPEPADWTGRMLAAGNGGFAGFIRYEGLARGVNRGMASASTDTGHRISEMNWSIGKPRRLENYGHRAQHLLAVNARKVIAAYYGRGVDKAYFMGCSGGGMQGMNQAQVYPADYDGIIAGAHGQSIVGISARWLTGALIAADRPQAHVTVADWKRIAEAGTRACDARDGLVDGIISSDPRQCPFDPGATPGLSPLQAETARLLYGPVLGAGGRALFPGFTPGVAFAPISEPGRPGELFAQWLHEDPNWDFRRFDAARDVPAMEAKVPGLAPTNPNLAPFFDRGGKMISFHGWNDEIVPAGSTIAYYENVARYLGPERAAQSYRLYLPAGMEHCRGGPGADSFGASFGPELAGATAENDLLLAMIDWVEKGRMPGRLVAAKLEGERVVMTRPLCPYPQVVRYRGKGDPNRAESFVCAAR